MALLFKVNSITWSVINSQFRNARPNWFWISRISCCQTLNSYEDASSGTNVA